MFYPHVMLCRLLSDNFADVERIASDVQKKSTDKDMIDFCMELMKLGLVMQKRGSIGSVEENINHILEQHNTYEIKFGLDLLLQNLVKKTVLKILKPYIKIQLDYLAKLTGLEVCELTKLLTKLIVDGQLDYIIDGQTNSLIKVTEETKPSEGLLRQACEVVEVLQQWFA